MLQVLDDDRSIYGSCEQLVEAFSSFWLNNTAKSFAVDMYKLVD